MVKLAPLTPSLKKAFSPIHFSAAASKATNRLTNHLERAQNRSAHTSYPAPEPESERTFWEEETAWQGGQDALMDRIIERSNHLHDPRYMGHQVACILPAAASVGMVTDLLNNGQAIYEMGPTNAVHEEVLMTEVGQMLGLPDTCGGILCHGGTLGNLVALMAAQRKLGLSEGIDPWKEGLHAFSQPLVVLVSEQAHYCIDRAMRTMGWGSAGVVGIKTNEFHQMCVHSLHDQINQCRMRGQRILAVVGSACTTSAGAYDPLQEIAGVCQEHGLWFHVDGAHGASAAFSDTHRHLVAGMERADSVVLDFHKTCGIPALCTGVFYADKNNSYLPFSQHAEYLWEHADEAHWWDTGKRTFECTKRMLSTRLAAIKAEYGWGIWTELVDRMWALGAALASMVKERPGWVLAMPPQANIVCFRPERPETCDEATWNEVVKVLRKRHLSEGSGYLVQTELDGRVWLRCTLMNPLTEHRDLKEMLGELDALLQVVIDEQAQG